MSEKKSISQLFTEQFEALRDEKVEEAERESRKRVLIGVIDALRNYFPLWVVVALESPRLTVMHCLGRINWGDRSEAELFYEHSVSDFLGFEKGTIYKRITSPNAIVPGVEAPSELSDNETKEVLRRLDEVVATGKMSNEIVAPSGFYVFRFTAGEREKEPTTRTRVIEADSLKDAIGEFEREFRFPARWATASFLYFAVLHDNIQQTLKADSISPPFHFSVI